MLQIAYDPSFHIQSSNFTTVGAKEVYFHFKVGALVTLAGGAEPQQHVPWSDTPFLCWAATHSSAQITADSFYSLCSCDFRSKTLQRQKEHVNTCILIWRGDHHLTQILGSYTQHISGSPSAEEGTKLSGSHRCCRGLSCPGFKPPRRWEYNHP